MRPGAGPCRATVAADCVTAYNDLKLSKKYKYVIFKLSDDNKEIVVEEASADPEWENFREKLINATTTSKTVRFRPKHAHVDNSMAACSRRVVVRRLA
jgi:hypothetical protein